MLDPLLGRGDFLLNVSVDVSSVALVKLCWEKGAMYLDTCIEPWPGGYTDPTVPAGAAHQLRAARGGAGAAPGNAARADRRADARRQPRSGLAFRQAGAAQHRRANRRRRRQPQVTREEWGELARKLGVKVIHIAERDTQVANDPEGARRVRQHLVGRRLRQRGRAAEPSSAGARTRRTFRATASATTSAAGARSI